MKEFTLKDETAFRLRVKSWKCSHPSDLNTIEFIQECKNKDGEIDFSSTYQFFMTDAEVKNLSKGLLDVVN